MSSIPQRPVKFWIVKVNPGDRWTVKEGEYPGNVSEYHMTPRATKTAAARVARGQNMAEAQRKAVSGGQS